MKKAISLITIIILALNFSLLTGCDFEKSKSTNENTEVISRSVDLYPASFNSVEGVKWGYIDNTGKVVIKPIFDGAEDFQPNGLAIVSTANHFGIIDSTGKYLVQPKYDFIDKFTDERAIATTAQGYAVIDEKGNEIYHTEQFISSYQDGRALFAVITSDKWLYGYIDKHGKVAIEPKYESAGSFNNGKAVVKLVEGGYAIINKNGEAIKKFNYDFVGDIGNGLLPFREKSDSKYGYINEKGKVIIKPAYNMALSFKNGRALVNMSDGFPNKYGVIDEKGKFIIKSGYNELLELGQGMFAAGTPIDKENIFKGSKYAIVDINGKFLTDSIYYGVNEYKGDLASAYDRSSTFFIDKMGKKVTSLPVISGSGSLNVEGDLIKALVDKRTSYMDKSGKLIWKQNSDVVLNTQYTVREVKYKPNRNYLVYYPQISGMENKQAQDIANNNIKKLAIQDNVDSNTDIDYSYEGDWNIEFYKKNLIVLEINGYNYPFGAAHGMPVQLYAHIDLKSSTGNFYELKDLFKKNSSYVKRLSDIIKVQIEKQGQDSYIWMDSYKGIKENQPFYVSKDGLNIYFFPYEIAPYAAGFPTFTIPFKDIMDIINIEGNFWKSFN